MHFEITLQHAKMRLDKFLTEHFPNFSRAHLQKLIEAGQVQVNGKPVTPHHFLCMGDEIEATIEPTAELRVLANPSVVLDIIHEEPDFIVVNKPAGLVVHQGEGHKAPDTLVNGLLARYPEIARVGDELVRPGIVHRLDGDVSGVMVIARTQDMFDTLKRQFKLHEIEKEYIAIVDGKVSPPSGTIEFAVARKGAKMVARPKGAEGRKAVTEYETVRHSERSEESPTHVGARIRAGSFAPLRMTLLKINTRTGRTHQIRVHLKAKGWPIVGDKLYSLSKRSASKGLRQAQAVNYSRLMLHARKIGFKDLSGTRREFICPEPEEFSS